MTSLDLAREILSKATHQPLTAVPADASLHNFDQWDSIAHVHIMLDVEERLGRDLTPDEIFDLQSVDAIATLLGEA